MVKQIYTTIALSVLTVFFIMLNSCEESEQEKAPTIKSLTASPNTVNYGDEVTISWETDSALAIELYEKNLDENSDPFFINTIHSDGFNSFYKTEIIHNTQFILKVYGSADPVAESTVDIAVNPVEPECRILYFMAIPNEVNVGEEVKLYFGTENCEGPVYIRSTTTENTINNSTDSTVAEGSYTWIADQSIQFTLKVAPKTEGNEQNCTVDCVRSIINVNVLDNELPE